VSTKRVEEEITILPPQLSEMSAEGGLPWQRAQERTKEEFKNSYEY
jgi:hypothetical protein